MASQEVRGYGRCQKRAWEWMPSRPAPCPAALRVPRNNGKWEACSPEGPTSGLAGLPHEVDTQPPPQKQLWEWRPGPRSQKPGRAMLLIATPARGPPSAKLAEAPPLAPLAPLGPCGGLISLQTLGPRAEGRKGDIAVVLRPRREHT